MSLRGFKVPNVADARAGLAIIILTYNSERIIEETLRQARKLTGLIVAVDSGSTDRTVDLLRSAGCRVLVRAFLNYADQRNWAISQTEPLARWQLHLDADEVMDDLLVAEVNRRVMEDSGNAYLMMRETYFLGKRLKFGGVRSWHLRLFRSGAAVCESRLYDQHFICSCKTLYLRGALHDRNISTLSEWTSRHNLWSSLEAEEVTGEKGKSSSPMPMTLEPSLIGDVRKRRRAFKTFYYKLPMGLRPWLYFFYRYIFRLGFLDGSVGFYYAVLQALWFRVLIDAKIQERSKGVSENTTRHTDS